MASMYTDFLVVGGGIAGVSCAELLAQEAPSKSVVLVTASSLVKMVTEQNHLTKLLTSFTVVETPAADWGAEHDGVKVVMGSVSAVLPDEKMVKMHSLVCETIRYGWLCLCTGARPKVISSHPLVLGIRDTESVARLRDRLDTAERVLVVGNGGIATELVYQLTHLQVVWAVKDKSINSAFVDPGAGEFLTQTLRGDRGVEETPVKRAKYTVGAGSDMRGAPNPRVRGSALGPDWHQALDPMGEGDRQVHVIHEVEVRRVVNREEFKAKGVVADMMETFTGSKDDFPVYAELTNDKVIGCDFIVSATGVVPGGEEFRSVLEVDLEGGIVVDDNMRTSRPFIYAAGDVCTAGWDMAKHWVQMRLWSQARLMGLQAARCMVEHSLGEEKVEQDFGFEMFAHVTKFFGYKVVLLGLFNGQKLETRDYEVLLRCTPGKEFVKVVMVEGRMQGALLIGETDLEETFENLILNQLDLSNYGEDLLDPNIDIEDYFD